MSRKKKLDQLIEGHCVSLETLNGLCISSVFALKHRSKKRIQVYGSSNTILHLGRLLEGIRTSGEYSELRNEIQDIEVVILETNVSSNDLRLKISNWIYEFECKGYMLYKDISPLKYVLETALEYNAGRLCYCLYVKNKGNDRKLVGVFEKKADLKQFVKEKYKERRISAIVYHESVIVKE